MLRVSLILILCLFPGILLAQLWQDHFIIAGGAPQEALDWDADGDFDVVSGAGGVSLIRNNLPSAWELDVYPVPDAWSTDNESADLGGDGDLDWVFYQGGVTYGALGWLENLGDWEFEAHIIQEFDEGSLWHTISAGDIEGDGDIDILATFNVDGSSGLSVWYNDGANTFSGTDIFPLVTKQVSELADFDGDGRLDFFVSSSSPAFRFYRSLPDGSFEMTGVFDEDHADIFATAAIGDFDSDGDLDFAVSHDYEFIGNTGVDWGENDGSGNFTIHPIDHQNSLFGPVAMLDADNDGDMDLACNNLLLLNQGDDLTFAQQVFTDVTNIDQLIAADIDNDGDTDLLNEDVRWFENPLLDPPNFIIRLVPRQVEIPGEGGAMVYDGMAYSQFGQPATGWVWARVTGPAGNEEIIWARQMAFTPEGWITYPNLTQFVPGWAPSGEYEFKIRAGIPGVGAAPGDSLTFVKVGTAAGSITRPWPTSRRSLPPEVREMLNTDESAGVEHLAR